MGRKVVAVKPRADPKAYTGKKRDRSSVWKPSRNPLLEQMRPMPPATYTKGHSIVAREATFDPLRGAFIILARPDEPEPTVPERRVGRATGRAKIPDNLTAAMSQEEHRPQGRLPMIHKRRGAPVGTRIDNDLGTGIQLHEMTAEETRIMWHKHHKALEQSIKRNGDFDGVTWRHRATKEPARPLFQHPNRRLFKTTSTTPYGSNADYGPEGLPTVMGALPKSGRRANKGPSKDQGERLLAWKADGDETTPHPPRKLPPSFTDGPHMDVMMDDMLSRDLAAPREKQRRHIAGHTGNIDEAIRPMDDRERRQLHAREMHEFTAVRRRGRDIAPLAVSPIDHTPSLRVHAHTARGVVLGRCSDQGNSSIPQRQRRNTAV